MINDYYFVCEGYLYTPWNGKIKEYKGEVWHRDEYRGSLYVEPENTRFKALDKHGRVGKTLNCSINEMEVCNKVVWLSESDKRKAAEILIEYEETQIAKLKMQLENHERLIETYKEEL